jgi:riboflavin kinase/FMN adenylyltransferase
MEVYQNLDELPEFDKTVITIGSFDGIHRGHQKILERLTNLSTEHNVTSIVVTFHPHPRSIVYPKDKSLRLLSSLQEKIELFEKFKVDCLVIVPFTIEFSQLPAQEYVENFLVRNFKPSYIILGYDHRFGLNRSGDINLLKLYQEEHNFQIVEILKQEIDEITISSTKIRNALLNGDLVTANTLLNFPYQLSGTVIKGRKLGTEIGFPTANILPEDSKKIVPKDGIYTCRLRHNKEVYNGMLYIGELPTIGTDQKKSIEVNIFDFDKEIYDDRVSIEILHYLRDDKKFDSIEALKRQLAIDREDTLRFFRQNKKKAQSKATIAILNYNTVTYLQDFLPSVGYSSQSEFDLLIIDNASEDDSVNYVSEWHPEAKVITLSENYGFAKGYNKGLSQVDTPYIVLLNSDVQVSENWLDPLIAHLDDNPDVAVVMPKIRSYADKDKFEYAGAAGGHMDYLAYPFCRGRIFDTVEKDEGQYDSEQEIFWASGAACVIRTEVFKSLGGFDSDYFAHQEEIDLCWRILRSGYTIKAIPTSIVYHVGGGSLDYSSPQKLYLNFRNNLFTLFKNDSVANLLWKLPMRFILDIIAAFKYLLLGNIKAFLAIIKAGLSFSGSIPMLIKKRKLVQSQIDSINRGETKKDLLYTKSILIKYFLLGKKQFNKL